MRTAVYIIVLAILACDSPTGPDDATRLDPPPGWIMEHYRAVAECLDVEPKPARWHVSEFLTHDGSHHLGVYYQPDRIYLDRRVLDNPDEWWAEQAVRHEAVHHLTGDMGHDGPAWKCDPGVPSSW